MSGAPTTAADAPAGTRRWGRVRLVVETTGLSKPKIFQLLKQGRLVGKKLDGVLLLDLDSVDRLIEGSPDWTPGNSKNGWKA